MSPYTNCFVNVKSLQVNVRLPYDSSQQMKHFGLVRLYEDLILTDVLHVPSFNFNLLLVRKILCDINLVACLDKDHCVLQGRLSKNIVVVG